MSSALSITRAVNPPRAVYLDYPLGHTTGKPGDADNQMSIMRDALQAFEAISEPGTIVELDYQWLPDDAWKDRVMRPSSTTSDAGAAEHEDDRVERFDTPQYQHAEDAALADPACATCVFLEETS